MKRILCFLIAFVMAFSVVSFAANEDEAIEIFTGGDLEGLEVPWDGGGRAGTGLTQAYVHGGLYSYQIADTEVKYPGNVTVATFDGFEGATYTFSMWMYMETKLADTSTLKMALAFRNESAEQIAQQAVTVPSPKQGEWNQVSMSFTAPENTASVRVLIRVVDGGTFYIDDCSLKVSGSKKIMDAYKEALALKEEIENQSFAYLNAQTEETYNMEIIEGAPNLITNPGFEEGDGVKPADWYKYGGSEWGGVPSRTDEDAHSGNYSMCIDATNEPSGSTGRFVSQSIYLESGFIPGQKYVLRTWVKVKAFERGGGPYLKIEPYSARYNALNTMLDPVRGDRLTFADEDPEGNEWHRLQVVIEVEEETQMLTFLLILTGPGKVYFDDVEFGLAEGGSRFELYPARNFCYEEDTYGTAIVNVNTAFYPLEPNSTIDFAIKDGDKVLESATLPAANTVEWQFNVKSMPEKLKKYTLEATYKDADGNPIGEPKTDDVYRTNRPTMLTADGNFIDENGEIFYPVIGYGDPTDYLDDANEHQITVLRSTVAGHDWDNLEEGLEKFGEMLDKAVANGYKHLISCGSSTPSGYPGAAHDRLDAILERYADHPGIFAWMVIDEVSLKIKNTNEIKTYAEAKHWLEESYIQIREKDTMHPVYVLDTGQRNYMEQSSRLCDIFATDPYPGAAESVAGYNYIRARWSTLGNELQTPTAQIVQMTPFKDKWRPSITAVRHQFYQAFWGGAKMVGFFSLTGASDMTLESVKDDPERWQDWLNFINSGEKDLMFEHFTTDKTTLICNWMENDVWHRMWKASDGNYYLVVMNMTSEDVTAEVKLVSNNGKVSIDGYTAELVNGKEVTLHTSSSTDNIFKLDMPVATVALFKINPTGELDLSKLDETVYDDISDHTWAETEIEAVALKNISNEINGGFAPAENITRADFAGWLIRTLGLTAEEAPLFDDVDPNHYYAKEIAMGKTLGILTGVGDNKYDPDASITRQDVMTICARGMEIADVMTTTGTLLRLDVFTDKGLIADYAQMPVAKMVMEGIIKGNPDQTINPVGNATRAEAAVMMYRIMYKGQIKTKA